MTGGTANQPRGAAGETTGEATDGTTDQATGGTTDQATGGTTGVTTSRTLNRRLILAIRLLAIAAIAVGLWWFGRTMDFAKLGAELGKAKIWPLVVAAALNFVCLWGKAACWRVMLAPRHQVSTLRLFRYTIATFTASAIAPARAGEVLRVWLLKRRHGVPAADSAAVAVAEKLLDVITMLILVAPVPWLLPDLPSWVARGIAIGAAGAIALFLVLVIAIGRVDPTKPPTLIRRFLTGMHVLRSPRRLLAALGTLFVVWFADLGMVMAVLYALDVHLPIAAGLLILFALNLAIAVPSTPAQVGALEAGAVAALLLLHVDREVALAFALLYHALQVIPLIAAGLIFELRLVLGRDGDRAAANEPAPHDAVTTPPPPAGA
jgi:uncharacterized membrane protein YbhN (UPF0104 family)